MNGEGNTPAAPHGEAAKAQVAITYDTPGEVVTVRASSCRDNGHGACTSCSTVHTMPEYGFNVAGSAAVPELQHAAAAARGQDGGALREGDGCDAVPGIVAEQGRRVITFEVLGTPAPKGSTHARMINGKAVNLPAGSSENRRKLRHWDTAIRETARSFVGEVEAPPFVKIAVEFHVEFRIARPAGHYSKATGKLLPSAAKFPIGKPDGDKLARQAADSLATIVFDDDSRIVTWHVSKRYALPGQEGALFTILEAA